MGIEIHGHNSSDIKKTVNSLSNGSLWSRCEGGGFPSGLQRDLARRLALHFLKRLIEVSD